MFRYPPPIRDIRRVLAGHPLFLEHGLRIALRHSANIHAQLRELDLLIERGIDLVEYFGIRTPSWPPLDAPIRPPTLHRAMATVLEARGNAWVRTSELAHEIARRGLYRRRDGLPATSRDIGARVCAYPHLFERDLVVVRLRNRPDLLQRPSELP
jgi:hypothetical protein